MIKIIQINAGEEAVVKEVDGSLNSFQKIVGGYVDLIEIKPGIDLWFNDEGKLNNLPPNILLYKDNLRLDVVVGNVFFASKNREGESIGLSDVQIQFINSRMTAGSVKLVNDEGEEYYQRVYKLSL